MQQVILGLGSNVGDRMTHLAAAVRELGGYLEDQCCSPVYESAAVLPAEAPEAWNMPYLNMACAGRTALSPEQMLDTIKAIEKRLGRQERGRWGPREIDIDILACGEETMVTPALTLPHPQLLHRDFALVPLADVAPHWRYPGPGAFAGQEARAVVHALRMGEGESLKRLFATIGRAAAL